MHGGAAAKPQSRIGKSYTLPVVVPAYSDKWANGDLVADYPVCPFNDATGLLPLGVKYSGISNIHDKKQKRHWGQRKLLLTEIDLLNTLQGAHTVVYAGAADGRHMPIITQMYPELMFHLYDPRPFYPTLSSNPQIQLNPYYKLHPSKSQNGWFTDEVAAHYKGKSVVFISDIRTTPSEEEIELNQRAQERWIQIMTPLVSMLKFKLPYPHMGDEQQYLYMRGNVRLQCWAPINSAETRLIIHAAPARVPRDKVQWERNMAWYNTVMRQHDFASERLSKYGVCSERTVGEFWREWVPHTHYGFDFVYELQILSAYLNRSGVCTDGALVELVRKINQVLISPGAKFSVYLQGASSR